MLCIDMETLLFCLMVIPQTPNALFTPELLSLSSPLVRHLDEEVICMY